MSDTASRSSEFDSDRPRESQLSFLAEASPAAAARPTDLANVAVSRRQAALRGIDGAFLLELAEPFAPQLLADHESEDADDANAAASPSSVAGPSAADPTQSNASLFGLTSNSNLNSTAHSAASSPNAAPREHNARVLIVGPSGSGKTTFRQCIQQVVRFSKPTAQPSTFASSSTFHFNVSASGNRPAEKLLIELVDTGPQQRAGITRLYRPADLVVLTWSLSTVKQTRKRTGLLSGTVETAVFHPRDIADIADYVRDLSVLLPGVPLVVIGTHKDVLSERATSSVEKVVQTLEGHVTAAIDAAARGERLSTTAATSTPASIGGSPTRAGVRSVPSTPPLVGSTPTVPGGSPQRSAYGTRGAFAPPILLGVYAISSVDGKCVGSSGGQAISINAMWRTVCESILKGARTSSPLAAASRSAVGATGGPFAGIAQLQYFDSPAQMADLVDRVRRFFTCLRAEHGIALLDVHHLAQSFFAFGAPSRKVVDAVLAVLQHRGDALVLDRSGEHPKQVLLLPHLPSRIHAALTSVATGMRATMEERLANRPKLVSLEDCIAADTTKELARGVLKGAVVRHMAACVPSDIAQDRTLVLVRVARQAGIMFRLNEGGGVQAPAASGVARRLYAASQSGSTAGGQSPTSKDKPAVENGSLAGAGSFFSVDSVVTASDKFIIPSLVNAVVAPTTSSALRRELDRRHVHSCTRHVLLRMAPTGFISFLQVQLGDYVVQRTHVTRTSVWLTSGSCRCFVVCDRDPAALPDAMGIDVVFVGGTGPQSLRSFALFVSAVMTIIQRTLHQSNVAETSAIGVGANICAGPTAPAMSSGPSLEASPIRSPGAASASTAAMPTTPATSAVLGADASPAAPVHVPTNTECMMTVSEASREDSIASLLRLDLCVVPLSG